MSDNNGAAGADNQPKETSISDQLLADAQKSGMKLEKSNTKDTDTDNNGGGGAAGQQNDNSNSNQNQNNNNNNSGAAADDDIEDEKILAALKKRGIEVTSFKDLQKPPAELSEEDKKKLAEEKRAKAISFGISKGVFSQAEYDESLKFQAREPLKVVQEAFTANIKKLNPEISDEDAEEMFNEHYFLLDDPEGTKYKLGQQALVDEYNKIKKGRFGKIDSAVQQYEGYEATQARAKDYQSQINTLFTGLPKEMEVKVNDETLKVPIDPAQLEAIKQDYLTTDMMNVAFDQAGKIDTKSISEEALKDLFWKNRDSIIAKVAVSYSDKQLTLERQGRKNAIRPEHTAENTEVRAETNSLSDRMLQGKA